ncbi:alfa-L-rhamnosidase [Microbacterium bovistercoris]|uniref:alpha-L-rhamnosidase n=1 Tax=Microbacterium bovistercoris TaxID=2293570 RepID=A0A371NTC6_9MICO|nr:family 78 glycoside hydrolase catalytic domain [Microbacterium bovistercoris]REJ05030.1 alfa-L-rhamnosidase [Microbacterium bovistercoris]
MRAIRLKTEHLHEPLGLGIRTPRFSWNCAGSAVQTAYRIVARRDGETLWDSGKVRSSRMILIPYEGSPLRSRDRIDWAVTLWDEDDVEGEPAPSWFELGLLDADDWTARWITGDYRPRRNTRYPVDCFRTRFRARGPVARARLYATALGLYDAHLNGTRVGDFELAPGSTDYRTRVQYQAYDVSGMLGEENTLELRLADGWYRGAVGAYGVTRLFGDTTALLAQLELTYADGTSEIIGTGDGFAWSNDGPLQFADLKDGEHYDARLTPTYRGRARIARPGPVPTASDNVAPRTQEEFAPTVLTTPSGATVLDFGQNIAGFIRLSVAGRAGQRIRLRLGEVLDEHGEFTQKNIQLDKPARHFGRITEFLLMTGQQRLLRGELESTPKQEILITCADGVTDYQCSFTVAGFRYALVQGDVDIDPASIRAVAVYSDLEQTGTFTSSNAMLDRFVENTRWSMKGNFLDVPTDCPTRERLGWTGDAQVFFNTAAYFMDVAAFFRKWMRDLEDSQLRSGKPRAVAPYSGVPMMYDTSGGSVGWADALVLVPYRLWKRYGDEAILREFYPAMTRYARYMISHTGHKRRKDARTNPFNEYTYEKGFHYGEWLEPKEFRDEVSARSRPLCTEEATAYLHYTMSHLAEIATQLDEPDDAARFAEYADGAKKAYNHLFVHHGTIDTDRQAKLVRPLALGLLDPGAAERVGGRLVRAVENRDDTIGTGFLSTPFVLPMLTEAGRSDVAYRMLENESAPSWLAQVRAGATTVWEDWEGEASQNHYAPGAVCEWLFDTVAGIRIAGDNRFVISPLPGGTLTHASAGYDSPYGLVTSAWRTDNGVTTFDIEIPANTTAEVHLPDGRLRTVGPGRHRFRTDEPTRPAQR